MTQVGTSVNGPLGGPAAGQVLAGRYRLDELVLDDRPWRRSVWRGTDTVLARTVAIELRVPGGEAAAEMLGAAFTTGRVGHPCLVGVYDAVDEGTQAYVVREWVTGQPLRRLVANAPLPPADAVEITAGVVEALAALHAAGAVHGNIQPHSVFADRVAGDTSVRVTDLRPTPGATAADDVRSAGAILYAALTGHWPAEIPAGPSGSGLPDAPRVDGRTGTPRQVRAGVPGYLDALTADLLDPALPAPSAYELAAELRRIDVREPDAGPLAVLPTEPAGRPPRWRLFAVLASLVAVIVFVTWLLGAGALTPRAGTGSRPPIAATTAAPPADPVPLGLAGATIVDPGGDGAERDGAEDAIDGDPDTSWRTASYTREAFGNLKEGMGVLVQVAPADAGTPVRRVTVQLNSPGATVDLRTADGVVQSPEGLPVVGPVVAGAPQTVVFELAEPVASPYWLAWITVLPPDAPDRSSKRGFSVEVVDVVVEG